MVSGSNKRKYFVAFRRINSVNGEIFQNVIGTGYFLLYFALFVYLNWDDDKKLVQQSNTLVPTYNE